MGNKTVGGISGLELLQRVYDGLFRGQIEEIVEFEEPKYVLVADDSDHHRIRRGFMKYDGGKVISLDGKSWIIGKGTPHGSYPANRFLGDIRIGEGSFPSSFTPASLIYPLHDSALTVFRGGGIGVSRSGEFKGLIDLVQRAGDFDLTVEEPGVSAYKPEFVDIWVERIEAELREKH